MKFIVIEGIDNSGKTTLIKNLENFIPNSILSEEKKGNFLKEILYRKDKRINKDNDIFLFMMNRYDQQLNIYKKYKNDPHYDDLILIQDRYYFSTIVYQYHYNPHILKFCIDPNIFPEPDLTIILDIDPLISVYRETATKNSDSDFYNGKVQDINSQRRNRYLDLPFQFQYHKFQIIDTNDKSENTISRISIDAINMIKTSKNSHERLFKNGISSSK